MATPPPPRPCSAPWTGRAIVVTDAVFSMDGDGAPVETGRAVADHDALLVLDEAHAVWRPTRKPSRARSCG